MKDLKISVIMPSFNQVAYIDEAIRSVLSQDYPNKELIIIDGGSTDGSVEIIKKYSEQLAYWVSEPDSGQSNAINKGFEKATGHLLTWSNSDDILLPGTLSSVANKAISIPDPMQRWIIGGCLWLDKNGSILRCTKARNWKKFMTKRGLVSVYSPSSFFSAELIDELGHLDETLHYAMDSELWLRFAKNGVQYTTSANYFWGLRLHEQAKVSGHLFKDKDDDKQKVVTKKREAEALEIQKRHEISDFDIKVSDTMHKLSSIISVAFWEGRIHTAYYQNQQWQKSLKLFS
ncbi:glycosyltransferase family 2 protein [Leptothoe sp. ISB3NOV94-8A]